MAKLPKMNTLFYFHFLQLFRRMTVGTNTDNDSLATFVAKWHYQRRKERKGYLLEINQQERKSTREKVIMVL